jgi:hypothetical protein
MFESVTERPSRWRAFWPDVGDLASAKDASRQGMWGAIVVGGVTAVAAPLGFLDVDSWALCDAALFLGIAWGIYKVWRTAAAAGLLLFLLERVVMFAQTKQTGGLVALALLLAFGNGARGAFAYRRLLRAESRRAPLDTDASVTT